MAFATVLSVTPRTRAIDEAGIPSLLRRNASAAIRWYAKGGRVSSSEKHS
jgi:hypothetical protein